MGSNRAAAAIAPLALVALIAVGAGGCAGAASRVAPAPEQAPALPIVVYCQHGPRAGVAWAALRLAGYTNVRYLDEHMAGWIAAGLRRE